MDRLLPWLRRTGWLYLGAALLVAALAWRLAPGAEGEGVQPRSDSPVAVERSSAPGALVHVAGEVRKPGVYRVRSNARVLAAVRAAGGPTRRAHLAGLNMAAQLEDGQQVVIPRRVEAGAAAAPGATPGGESAGPVSLSSATVEQLDAIDGIGPTIAGRIIEFRQQRGGFASVDQLLEVPGIGEGRLEALRPHVVP